MYGMIGIQLKDPYGVKDTQVKCYYLPGFTVKDAFILDEALCAKLIDKQITKTLYNFNNIRWVKRNMTYKTTEGRKRLSICAFGKVKEKVLIFEVDTANSKFSSDIFNVILNSISLNIEEIFNFLKLKKNFVMNGSVVISTESKVHNSIKGQFLKASGGDYDLVRRHLTTTSFTLADHTYQNMIFVTPGMKRKEMEEYWYTYVIPQYVLLLYSRHETKTKAAQFKIEKVFLDIAYLLAKYV